MKKNYSLIILSIISFAIVEVIIYVVFSGINDYNRTLSENESLREELKECREKLERFENPNKPTIEIKYRALKAR